MLEKLYLYIHRHYLSVFLFKIIILKIDLLSYIKYNNNRAKLIAFLYINK